MDPHIAWITPVASAAKINGSICPKGQSGLQGSYAPYRIVRVLKLPGARGEEKWNSIPFDRAITEITEGGALFPQDGGRTVEGLRSLYALRDRNLYSQMGADVIPGDPSRATGIHANSAMVVDPHLRSPLSDVVGGSAVFYDSKVFLVKV